jgi:hypothetical protein
MKWDDRGIQRRHKSDTSKRDSGFSFKDLEKENFDPDYGGPGKRPGSPINTWLVSIPTYVGHYRTVRMVTEPSTNRHLRVGRGGFR